ncbi:hypothetical protein DPV78_004809 [Talaromyces pinophilus]|nr:hypothetical protein DPV78_004809 [Talaromyces pinophilus]
MARLLAFILSSLAITAATPLTSDTSKQLSARQLPQCAGYGSVCRVDFTNRVNGTSGEFYTEDGDFCTCAVSTHVHVIPKYIFVADVYIQSLIGMSRSESYVSNPSAFLSNDRPITKSKQQCSTVFVEDNNQVSNSWTATFSLSCMYPPLSLTMTRIEIRCEHSNLGGIILIFPERIY